MSRGGPRPRSGRPPLRDGQRLYHRRTVMLADEHVRAMAALMATHGIRTGSAVLRWCLEQAIKEAT